MAWATSSRCRDRHFMHRRLRETRGDGRTWSRAPPLTARLHGAIHRNGGQNIGECVTHLTRPAPESIQEVALAVRLRRQIQAEVDLLAGLKFRRPSRLRQREMSRGLVDVPRRSGGRRIAKFDAASKWFAIRSRSASPWNGGVEPLQMSLADTSTHMKSEVATRAEVVRISGARTDRGKIASQRRGRVVYVEPAPAPADDIRAPS
jgi:hypothetical protein